MNYVLAIHGGAGVIAQGGDEALYHAGLQAALMAGEVVLRDGGSAVDAVLAAVIALEDCPVFNAGFGAVFTSAGTHELDASIMDGRDLSAGAVAGVAHVQNPIRAAHAVLKDGRFVLLNGAGADQFALDAGLPVVPNNYFSTAHRYAQLERVQRSNPDQFVLDHSVVITPASIPDPEAFSTTQPAKDNHYKFGTVGAVALDQNGHLAAATSTGGMTNKKPGRVGDTPLIGAGVYANDASCAVSATGTGEHFIRACVAHDIHARMQYASSDLATAAHATIHESMAKLGGEGGVVALGRDGSLAFEFNSLGMYRGWVRAGEDGETRVF